MKYGQFCVDNKLIIDDFLSQLISALPICRDLSIARQMNKNINHSFVWVETLLLWVETLLLWLKLFCFG